MPVPNMPNTTANTDLAHIAAPRDIVFVDSRVQDSAELLKGLAPGVEVVYLRAGEDGLQQMAAALGGKGDVGAVHILAHGSAGQLWLGSTFLDSSTLNSHADALAAIGRGLTSNGDLLVYSCDLASGDVGAKFVANLANLTGAVVAASDNRTGVGGDWKLEVSTGHVDATSVLSQAATEHYNHSLGTLTVTSNADSGIGSLRNALASANAGDTITFSSGMTVALNSQLIINKNLTIDGDLNNDGVADVTLDGQYRAGVLNVTTGNVTLDGLVITHGLIAGNGGNGGAAAANSLGAGISNSGNLTLDNVSVTANAASGGGGGGGIISPVVGGAGGGGGAVGGGIGGHGGSTGNGMGNYAGGVGTPNHGGVGGSYNLAAMSGHAGSSVGGTASVNPYGYANGSAGGTAASGALSIGGGGGGAGWNTTGGKGGAAAGGIYNASSGTLTIVGTSTISGNIGAGGGGGGGSAAGSGTTSNGGDGGKGVGAIWNKGTVLITAANYAALGGSANAGGSGIGGLASAAQQGNTPAAVNGFFNDAGATVNPAYNPAPTATLVVSNTAQHIGSTSLVTITFNQAVTGFTNADLTVPNGTLSAVSSSDGGTTWTATFTPNAGVTSAANQIVLDNTGVQNTLGTAGVGSTSSNSYAIDTQRPTASIVVANPALAIGQTSLVTITFSEKVTGFTNAELSVANGTLSAVSSSDGGMTWTATFTPTAGTSNASNLITLDNTGVADLAGNAGTGITNSNNYAIDTQRPTATIALADSALTAGKTSLVTFTFSEAVTGFTNADLTVPNGTLSAVSSSDGGVTWTATYTPAANTASATNVITLANTGVADLAGNAGAGTTSSANFTINTMGPTATIAVAQNAFKIGDTSLVTITFSEAVTGFTNADLTVANGTLSAVSSSDGGITWTATLTPAGNVTAGANVITLDNTGVQDLSGNAGFGSTSSNSYAIDTLRPTASIVVANPALAIGQTSLVTITFSEKVTGFTNADLSVANGTLSAVSSGDGGMTWTATFTPSAGVTNAGNLITLANNGVSDLAGNAGAGTTTSNTYAIDTQRPTATIVLADTALIAGKTSPVTITFSEAVTGFTNADLTVANGTLSAVSSSDGGVTWNATYTPAANTASATNVITLANTGVADLAGNAGAGTTNSANFTIDTLRPTATIAVAQNALKIGDSSLVTITFSEAVTGFTNADLTVANGTLSAVSSSDGGITWTATLTPTGNVTAGANVITLDNTGVQDLSGNAGVGSTSSNSYAIDTLRPTASIVVANPALAIGQTSLVTITFSEKVTGFTNADLTVANGTLSAVSSSDGGMTWTATYTPAAGISNASNAITLANNGVTDLAGNAGAGTTTSNNYAIDTMRPTATIVLNDTALIAGKTSLVTITFSEAVTGFTNADLTVPNGTLSAVSSSDGGVTWSATYTPAANTTSATNVITLANTGVADLAGNAGAGTTNSVNFTIDTVRPTATIVVADAALKVGATSLVTVTFSEAVTGFTNADLTVANGTLSAVSSSDGGITWTATLTPTGNVTAGANLISLDNSGVQNASGNTGVGSTSSNNYAIDTLRPTASIVVANPALAIGQTSLVTITFSEKVTGFTNADLTVANGTLSAVSSSDGGLTWTATFTPTAGISNSSNLITLDNTGVADLAGNAGAGTTTSNTYAIDTQRPTATIALADSALIAGKTSLVTFTFSEAVTGFTNADLTVPNGTLSTVSSSDGGVTWTATYTPAANTASATNVITLANTGVADLAGNAGAGTTSSANFTIDTLRPTATIAVAQNAFKIGDSSLVTITFSEAVSGFTNADLTVANGTLSAVSSSDGGITWTATLTPTGNVTAGANVITLDNTGIQDLSGNAGAGSTSSNNYAIDTQPPTASIVVANPAVAIGQTSLVTITFSEKVTGFTNADLTVANGTLSAVSSSDGGVTWTATFTPTADISNAGNVITLTNNGVTDLAGNAGAGTTTSNNYAIDTLRPTASIVLADSALIAGKTSLVTITFSEAITGFTNADLSVANGTLSAVSSSDGGVTWTATYTPAANTASATNVITLANTGVADLAGNAGAGTTNSANFTIDTLRPTATIAVAQNALKIGDASLVTITFSEAVTGFTNADLTVANGTLSAVSSSDGGITWTATLTPTGNVTAAANVITLDNTGVKDLSGNAGVGSTSSNNYAIDTQRPTASIVVEHSTLAAGETSQVTITFSEKVTGFDNTDLHVENGTLSAVTSSDGGKTWIAKLTPVAGVDISNNLITLSNSGVTDLAGNAGSGTTQSNNYVLYGADHSTPPPPANSDKDNIPDAVEDLVPGFTPAGGGTAVPGDGNGDGIPDSKQPDVTSLPLLDTPTAQSNPGGAPPVYVTLVGGSVDGKIVAAYPPVPPVVLNDVHQLDSPHNLPAELKMPLGLIAFSATVPTSGATENFSLYVDPALGVNGYWKLNAAGMWVNLASAAYGGQTVLEGGRLRLDFHLTDGGEFDADGKADGTITELGAAGSMPLSVVGHPPSLPAGGHFWF